MQPSGPHLIVEPDDGVEPVRQFIGSAQSSLLIKQFTFTHEILIHAVIARHDAGVDVRVMLNPKRSGGDRANDETYELLRVGGCSRAVDQPQFLCHAREVDRGRRASALVATFNLCEKYFTLTRDYGIITTNPVRGRDRRGLRSRLGATGLGADDRTTDCCGATRTRASTWRGSSTAPRPPRHPAPQVRRRSDPRPHRRRRRSAGVKVRVLCGGKHGISEWDILDTFSSLRTLRRFGVKVHKQKNLRVHAKLLIVDGERALLGSMNIDRSAFDLRRELGIIDRRPRCGRPAQARLRPGLGPVAPLRPARPASSRRPVEDDFAHDRTDA